MANQMLDAALELFNAQFKIFPVSPKSKLPMVKWSKEYCRSTADVRRYWEKKWPQANIGWALPAMVQCFDIDPRNDGLKTLNNLRKFAHFPNTLMAKTGGGGVHMFYTTDQSINRVNGLGEGIDLKGAGGFVVLPPSLHASGERYEWGGVRKMQPLTPALRELVYEGLNADLTAGVKVGTDWEGLELGSIPDGRRNDTLARVTGALLHGVHPTLAYHLVHAFNDSNLTPSLSRAEVDKTFNSIAKSHFSEDAA